MKPGRFHASTGAPIGLKAGESRILPLIDVDGVKATEWILAVGDTGFDIQCSDMTFPAALADRPSRLIVDIVRKGTDRTARCTRSIAQIGSRAWADVFGGREYVDPDDGPFYFVITNDGKATTTVGLVVVKAINERAQFIDDLGGFNRWSDGVIR